MAYRSSAIISQNAGVPATATPSGVQVGDYLCGVAICDSQTPGIVAPTGWTIRATALNTGPDGQTMAFADSIATGSDSFTWTNSAGGITVINAAVSGRNTAAPRTALVTDVNVNSNVPPITVTSSGVTATQGDDVLVFMQIDEQVSTDTWSFSATAGYTVVQNGGNVNFARGAALQQRDNVNAGATGTLASTATRLTGTGNGGWSTIAVSIAVPGNPASGIRTPYIRMVR